MKTFEEFVKALETDDALKAKVKEAFSTVEVKSEEAKIATLVKIAAENGYNVSVEDFAKRQSACQELDEDELKLVSGGVKDICWFDYICSFIYNTCYFSEESSCDTLTERCTSNMGGHGI